MDLKQIIGQYKEDKELNPAKLREFLVQMTKELVSKEISDAKKELDQEIKEKFNDINENIKTQFNGTNVFDKLGSIIEKAKGDKGEDGKTPTEGELLGLIKPLIPEPIAGKDYILTEDDKKEISNKIKVPVVEKVIERTEVIKEQPIITNEIKEVAVTDKPEVIAEKLNTLTEKVDKKVIKGLEEELRVLRINIQEKKGGGSGGGMGNVQHERFNLTSASTTVTTAYGIAGGGFAVWAFYNGQEVFRGSAYTVGSNRRTITLSFTPDDDTIFEIIYFRG